MLPITAAAAGGTKGFRRSPKIGRDLKAGGDPSSPRPIFFWGPYPLASGLLGLQVTEKTNRCKAEENMDAEHRRPTKNKDHIIRQALFERATSKRKTTCPKERIGHGR